MMVLGEANVKSDGVTVIVSKGMCSLVGEGVLPSMLFTKAASTVVVPSLKATLENRHCLRGSSYIPSGGAVWPPSRLDVPILR